ncbi:ribose ABC transporter permease [Microbacterium sp. MYb54]|nr:ribose ABC transporter permease [Microbacterium sp. MYb43]PQZ78426.1 ribose ABC transporter permease [Microbacterium sp. MYb40]PRB20659.1 ribose ABC transporter permease [Microbacterium sp. MYb54]PRB28394.1 ribose ABC transporter permease [Microbacterium sp. MYb50]PRB66682.1 ribose ABC transporter permease [Microbacterium sp. MYb24]PRB74074.1 ribose ABC transporter permease [Microbacterium sp. MYb32]
MPRVKELGIVAVLIVLVIAFSVMSPNFLDPTNILNIARQIATLGIVAVGFSFVLITGGIDLSVGYQISLNVVVTGMLMAQFGVPWFIAVLLALVLGTLVGLVNGLIITFTGVAPLIVTLSMMMILNGLSYLISKGLPIFGFPSGFSVLGQGAIAGIPVSVYVLVAVWAVGLFILNKTYIGRYFYAIGNNVEAARLSGVNTRRTIILVYALCGFFTSIGAVLLLSRLNSAQSATGAGFEFSVLTACVLGGISVMGGRGSLFGAFVGVMIVGVLDNGLVLMNVSEYVQLVIKGCILLAAVIYDAVSKKSRGRRKQIGGVPLAPAAISA